MIVACNQKSQTSIDSKKPNTISSNSTLNKTTTDRQENVTERFSFNNVLEIVADNSSSIWVEKQGNNFSLALHFQYKDTLAISYSPECWFRFPYKLDENKIIVYWDNFIDTKYEFDIVKAMYKTDKKYIGKSFMSLELANDTTFNVTYLLKEPVRKINESSKKRTFFPDKFNLVQDGEMYD